MVNFDSLLGHDVKADRSEHAHLFSLATLTRLSEKPGNIVSAVDSLLKNSNSENEEQRDIATLGEFSCPEEDLICS